MSDDARREMIGIYGEGPLDVWAELKKLRVVIETLGARIAELETSEADLHTLTQMQAAILTRVVNAIKGAPPELKLWSHHDAGELAIALVNDRDRLRQAIAGFLMEHKGYPVTPMKSEDGITPAGCKCDLCVAGRSALAGKEGRR